MDRRGMRMLSVLTAAALALGGFFACSAAEEGVFIENEWNFVDASMDISGGIPENAGGVLGRIREQGVLRVATEPYFAPQEFIDPAREGQETFAGADMELARLIAEKMGVTLEIVPMEFTEVLSAVSEDRCDLAISALAYTPGRALNNTLSKGYFFTESEENITMVIREEDAEKITSVDDLENLTLTAQRGSLQEAVTVDMVPRYREFRRVLQTQEVYEMVRAGRADAGAVDMENAESYIRNNPGCGLTLVKGIRFSLEEQYAGDRIAAKKGEAELMYFVNGVIDEVLEKDLYRTWYEEARKRADELDL